MRPHSFRPPHKSLPRSRNPPAAVRATRAGLSPRGPLLLWAAQCGLLHLSRPTLPARSPARPARLALPARPARTLPAARLPAHPAWPLPAARLPAHPLPVARTESLLPHRQYCSLPVLLLQFLLLQMLLLRAALPQTLLPRMNLPRAYLPQVRAPPLRPVPP